jgi:hypothetical protein
MKIAYPPGLVLAVLVLLGPLSEAQEMRREGRERGRRPFLAAREDADGVKPPFLAGKWMERLKQDNPDEFRRMQELREEDPERFQQVVRERLRDRVGSTLKEMVGRYDDRARELSRKYHEATSEEQKAELRQQLEDAVGEAFDARLSGQKRLLKRLEEQLDNLRGRIETREAHKDEICRQRLQELTRDPDLRW